MFGRAVFIYLFLGVLGCPEKEARSLAPAPAPAAISSQLQIVQSFPHDSQAFTQGLHFFDGKLYESTGLLGRSSVRRVDLKSGVVEQRTALPHDHFGEGLTQVGDRLIQLTWQNRKALIWDQATLKKIGELPYEGEGWGLCYDGKRLVMSDGSDNLTFRHPTTFAIHGTLAVRRNGNPLSQLNELECANGVIFANVWQDDHIAVINPQSGQVTQWIDARPLREAMSKLAPDETLQADVLNGIALLPATNHLLLTGKHWPRLFEVAISQGTTP
jgi:glutamine cyclotransferase